MHHEISLSQKALDVIRQHAQQAYPFECCGFLFGIEGETRQVTLAVPVPNSKEGDQRRRFEISPADYRWAELHAIETGLDLLGVYHSHPDHPALASATDLAMALPWFSYVIVAVHNGQPLELRSWRLAEAERIFEEENAVLPEGHRELKPAAFAGRAPVAG
ncbi:MAG: Mov34/MPN/PAD-1 family protein [Saprospiraceae bacterium]|nr:MAG: Mov34/MPN/PAD-1 family protein [Saprospiraceae bacterium]